MLPAVRPATLLRWAAGVTMLLTALSLWIRIAALDDHDTPGFPARSRSALAVAYRLFSSDDESNVPTWFSGLLLAAIALVCLGVSALPGARDGGLRRYWLGLVAVFAYLSLDELARVHEELNWQLEALAERGGLLAFPWVMAAAPLVAVFAVLYVGFLRRLPRHIATLLVLAGALYVGGALGLEVLGGPSVGFNLPYVLVTGIEEMLEMSGAALCLYAVARYADELAHPVDGAALGGGGDAPRAAVSAAPPLPERRPALPASSPALDPGLPVRT